MKEVYEVTGRPSPADVDQIFEALNMKKFNDALKVVWELKQQKSLSIDDLIKDLHKAVMKTKYTEEMRIFIVSRLASIEYRLAQGSNEKLQMASLVGAFIEVRSFKK